MRHRLSRHRWGIGIALVGAGIVGFELYNYWRFRIPLSGSAVGIGAVVAFIGGYFLDPSGSKDVAAVVVDGFTQVVSVVRTGRRKSDAVVAVASAAPVPITAPAPPTDAPGGMEQGEDD